MNTIQELIRKKEEVKEKIANLEDELDKIDSELDKLDTEKATSEYEAELRKNNPGMWFRHDLYLGGHDYIHVTKVIDAFGTDLIRGVRRIHIEIDRRVSFGRDKYIKVSVDTEVHERCYDENELMQADIKDIESEILNENKKQINALTK